LDYEHGSMDVTTQEHTFHGFLKLAVWVAAIALGVLVFLALANA